MKFLTTTSSNPKSVLAFTKSQFNLFKRTTHDEALFPRTEEYYNKYISGAMNKASLTLDPAIMNKVLKKRDKTLEDLDADEYKRKMEKMPLMNRAKFIAERTKAAVTMSEKWTIMEELRIKYSTLSLFKNPYPNENSQGISRILVEPAERKREIIRNLSSKSIKQSIKPVG
jgi:signal recognition particle subunit SEC65